MHEMYRAFTLDPDIFADMELYEKNRDLAYDPAKVDALFDRREAEEGSVAFAVMLGGAVIGEVGLRHFSPETKECELSIHMQNDAVKNRGYGTRAEQLAVDYAFDVLGAERVVADSIIKNVRSRHVLEKLGFKYLGEEDGFKLYALERKDAKRW